MNPLRRPSAGGKDGSRAGGSGDGAPDPTGGAWPGGSGGSGGSDAASAGGVWPGSSGVSGAASASGVWHGGSGTACTGGAMYRRDTTGLTAENRELKLRLQSMEEQAKLRDALNEALQEEVQRLKIAAGQAANMNRNPFNGGLQQQIPSYFSQQQHMSYLGGHQAHHRNPSHHQSSSNGGQSLSGQSLNYSMDLI